MWYTPIQKQLFDSTLKVSSKSYQQIQAAHSKTWRLNFLNMSANHHPNPPSRLRAMVSQTNTQTVLNNHDCQTYNIIFVSKVKNYNHQAFLAHLLTYKTKYSQVRVPKTITRTVFYIMIPDASIKVSIFLDRRFFQFTKHQVYFTLATESLNFYVIIYTARYARNSLL